MHYLLLCRSLTYAQRAEKLLERKGITATVVKSPKDAAVHGCSYCVRIHERSKDRALLILMEAALMPERMFSITDGKAVEVAM